jgi:hypothetical protein
MAIRRMAFVNITGLDRNHRCATSAQSSGSSVTQAAYRAIQASLPPNSIMSPGFDPEAPTVHLWLDRKIADGFVGHAPAW